MASSQILTSTCFSRTTNSKVPIGITNDLTNVNFNGEGGTTILEHIAHFLEFCTHNKIHCEDTAYRFFILTFKACIEEWCYTLPTTSIHSFEHIVKELYHACDRHDYKFVYKKIMHLRKALDEYTEYFHDHFIHLCYEFYEDDVNWNFMKEKFKFIVHISMN